MEVEAEVRLDRFEGLVHESWTVFWGKKEDEEGLQRGVMSGIVGEERGFEFAVCGTLGVELVVAPRRSMILC